MEEKLPCSRKIPSSLRTIVIIYLVSDLPGATVQTEVCMTEKCVLSAARILESMDNSVDPCEDFHKFACGNYERNTIIPEDRAEVDQFTSASDITELQLMNLLEEPIRDSDPKFYKLVKSIYSSCMNTSKIEQEGLSYAKREFKRFGGWPVVESHWDGKFFNWINLEYRFKKDGWGSTFFFDISINNNLKDSTQTILTLSQPSVIDDRLIKGLNDTTVQATYDYYVELAVLFGADRATAIGDIKDVLDFEIEMANFKTLDEDRRDPNLHHNPTTIRNLQRTYKSLPWLKLINNYLSPTDMFRYDDVINVATPKFFEKFSDFWPKVPERTLANYMFLTALALNVDYLPEAFVRNSHAFMKTVYGIKDLSPRWKYCVSETKTLYMAMSSFHIRNLFAKSTRDKVIDLAIDIHDAFLDRFKAARWMDQKTKQHAIQKLEDMGWFIGYRDQLLDDKIMEEYHQGLELDPNGHYLQIGLNLSKFNNVKYVQSLRDPDGVWKSQCYTYVAGAYYEESITTIEIPAGILQDHFYDPDRPQYMNYGALGQIIGHEMTHAFDNIGRQYDKDGNVADWWEPETDRTFLQKSQCFVEQYGNCTVPEVDMNLNGSNTLRENIADNGAVKLAYAGYWKWLQRNEKVDPRLPGLPYSGFQLFWITAAMSWCAKYTKENLRHQVVSESHSPFQFRGVIPFKNFDQFGKDFNCPIGSPMNPVYKCSVW